MDISIDEQRKKKREYDRQYYLKNKEKAKENARQYHYANKTRANEKTRQYHQEHKEEAAAYIRQYYQEHKEEAAAYRKQWRLENPDKLSKARKKAKLSQYNLTLEQYQKMLEQQNNCCSLCGLPFEKKNGLIPHVDHDHETGQVRSILHAKCNLLIGLANDSDIRLYQAIRYLQRHKSSDDLLETAMEG